MQSQRFIDSAVRLIVHKIRLVKVVVDMIQLDTFQFDGLNRSVLFYKSFLAEMFVLDFPNFDLVMLVLELKYVGSW